MQDHHLSLTLLNCTLNGSIVQVDFMNGTNSNLVAKNIKYVSYIFRVEKINSDFFPILGLV